MTLNRVINAEGIVLRVESSGSSGKIIEIFTREYGKKKAVSFGVRRINSRLAAYLQPFAHLDISFISTSLGANGTISQCEYINSNQKIRDNLECTGYGYVILELIQELWPYEQRDSESFDKVCKILNTIQYKNPRITVIAGAWQLLSKAGFTPDTKYCTECGQPLKQEIFFYTNFVCTNCSKNHYFIVRPDVINFINFLLAIDWNHLESFKVSNKTIFETEQILENYILGINERPLKSFKFIKNILR